MRPTLYKLAHSPLILEPFINEFQCGWFDGGCFIFARALQIWLGRRLAVIVRERLHHEQTFDHCLLSIRVKGAVRYIDANGASSKADLLQYWRNEERLENPILEDPSGPLRLRSRLERGSWSAWLAQHFTRVFGNAGTEEVFTALDASGKSVCSARR